MTSQVILEVKNISKHFGGVNAVNDCSFEVKQGKITALIGPNGSGKSTLFNIISGVLDSDKGKIVFAGKDIEKLNPEKRAGRGMSRVFQQPRLFGNLTVLQNLLLALNENDTKFWTSFLGLNGDKGNEKKAISALEIVGMEQYKNKTASELSFGQKRLVELARAMLKKHLLLLLDEPVGGVTPPLRKKIASLLTQRQKEGGTILLVEHDMNFVLGIADEVFVLDEGKIIAHGKPSEIRKNKKVREAYLGD